MKPTKQQLELLELAKKADKDSNDAILYLFTKTNAKFKKLNDTVVKAFKALEDYKKKVKDYKDNIPDLGKYLKSVRGKEGKIGERGERGESIRGKDGKDANEEKIIKKVIKKIPIPKDGITPIKGIDYFDGINGKDGVGTNGADGSPDTSEIIKNKLEFLKKESRLKISAIKNLEKRLKELEERPMGGGGGGFSKIHMEQKFIDDQTFTGIQNGVNKIFTIIRTPNPLSSLKVYRGGARQRITEDYTVSGKTVTFLVAPSVGEIILYDLRI